MYFAISVLFAALLPAGPALGGPPAARPLPLLHRHFSSTDGLPETGVPALLQTRDGFLWIGSAGLARFNGVTFQLFSEATTPGLAESDLTALAEDAGGGLWVGGAETGGLHGPMLGRLQGGRLTRFGGAQGLQGREVLSLLVGPTGTVWVGTDAGAARLEGDRLSPVAGLHGRVLALLEQEDGELLAGTPEGLWSVRGLDVRAVPLAPAGKAPERAVQVLLRARSGAVWAGTPDGLYRLDQRGPGRRARLGEGDGLPGAEILSLCEDHVDRLWIGTSAGLAVLEPGATAARRVPEVTSSVLQIREDREHSLWIGTEGSGLHQLRDAAVEVYDRQQTGLTVDAIFSVSIAPDGSVWAGGQSGIAHLDGSRIESWPTIGGKKGVIGGAVVHTSDGRVWLGTGAGLARLEKGALKLVGGTDGLPEGAVRALLEDREHGLWIGTPSGLYRWQDGAATTFHLGAAGSAVPARAVVEDRAGRIWAATLDGLYRIVGGVVTRFSRDDGLVSDQVTALLVDGDDVWAGTGSAGLHLIRGGGRVFPVPLQARIRARSVLGLALDRSGQLWQASEQGLYRASRHDLAAAALGEQREVSLRRFDALDGLPSLDFNQYGQAGAALGSDGSLWFANTVGLVHLDPARLRENHAAPLVVIERVLVNGRPAALDRPLRFPVGAGALEIAYDAPCLRVPERVRFRFRLEGSGEQWSEAGTRRVASFHSLPSGRHVFQVTAANDDGLWSEAGASLEFTLDPPFWRTGWFASLGLLALGGAVLGSFRWWSAQSRRREQLLRAQVEERTSQLAAANQDLAHNLEELGRAQQHLVASDRRTSLGLLAAGVAHEINNPLSYITTNLAFIRDALPNLAAERAGLPVALEVRDALDEALEGAQRVKKIVGGLKTLARGDRGSPRTVVDVQTSLGSALDVAWGEIKHRAEVVKDLHPVPLVLAEEVQLLQVFLNLLINAAQAIEQAQTEKKPGPHQVRVRTFTDQRGWAVVEVSDTGAGMTPEARARLFTPFFTTKPVGTGTGLGLSTSQGIVVSLGGTIEVESEEGKGALFTVKLPPAESPPPA